MVYQPGAEKTLARVSSEKNPSKPTKPTKSGGRYYSGMNALIVIVAVLALLAVLSALVMIPYLCAMATGRVLGWVFQVEPDSRAFDARERLRADGFSADTDELVAYSKHMASESVCRSGFSPNP